MDNNPIDSKEETVVDFKQNETLEKMLTSLIVPEYEKTLENDQKTASELVLATDNSEIIMSGKNTDTFKSKNLQTESYGMNPKMQSISSKLKLTDFISGYQMWFNLIIVFLFTATISIGSYMKQFQDTQINRLATQLELMQQIQNSTHSHVLLLNTAMSKYFPICR